MQHIITYRELYAINADIKGIQRDNAGASFLLYSKIKLFYDRARVSLQVLQKNISDIQHKYIEHDENDQAKRVDPKDSKSKWIYKSDIPNPDLNNGEVLTAEEAEKFYGEEMDRFLESTTKIDY